MFKELIGGSDNQRTGKEEVSISLGKFPTWLHWPDHTPDCARQYMYFVLLFNTFQYFAIIVNTLQYLSILCNTFQNFSILEIVRNSTFNALPPPTSVTCMSAPSSSQGYKYTQETLADKGLSARAIENLSRAIKTVSGCTQWHRMRPHHCLAHKLPPNKDIGVDQAQLVLSYICQVSDLLQNRK